MTTPGTWVTARRTPGGRGTAVPLVKATLRGILPHGSEVPWVPIPLRSMGLDNSPCLELASMGFVQDESLFPPEDVSA
jgi:hypothetical protein